MKGVAISTVVALVLMVLALIILWAFFQPILTKGAGNIAESISQAIYKNTICKLNVFGVASLLTGLECG